jgi:hypothetical protein
MEEGREGRKEGRRERGKEGGRERGREGRKEGGKEGRKERWKERQGNEKCMEEGLSFPGTMSQVVSCDGLLLVLALSPMPP